MTSPAVLTILLVTVAATITSPDSCTSPTSTDISVSRENLASWLENIFSPDWEDHLGPGPETDGECREVLSASWCSWGEEGEGGECHSPSHYSGPASLTLQDGSRLTGRVEAGVLSGPVNITLQERYS